MSADESEVPLIELLEKVPENARFVEEESFSSTYHPVGNMCRKAAAMLRHQADYITHLEEGLESALALNKAQVGRSTDQELVAWIAYDEFGDFMLEATPEGDYPWQPLYTHPTKTLTDEEIITVLTDKFVKDQGRYASTNLFYIEFARAILKKASEK